METTGRKPINLVWMLATLTGLSVAGGMLWHNNRRLMHQYDLAEQRADSLLSVKLQLEGDNRDLEKQLESTADENAYLDTRINDLHGQLSEQVRSVNNLYRNKTEQIRSIRTLNQNLHRQGTVCDSLENELMAMHDKLNWQSQSNALLISQKTELQEQQKDMNAQLLTMVPRSAITADAFRIEVSKPNNKITAKAKKATRLNVSLNVPATLKMEGVREVYLSLSNEQRQPMMAALRNVTVMLPTINEVVPVHAEQSVNFDLNPQRISFQIMPSQDVTPGTYRASVYTKDAYLGSVEFRLRDSFWFF